ncbi:peptidyl-tRNA hydrolase 2, mitochondrial-like [Apis laboriosa]|uniref:peptidyl-tRNA hydrolase 2, mitochondrial-like n=1 Tax=Apis laboriosa TaxID=183418 RepID=UPI001CC6943E|nr:peptidyl-tRNA hydrolase 2, mitochondrial-like [Apis laboriosa]XP_043803566.1 peptidyl-tRNA hydrolase 2, mitochondrial-like [Apis laboriosa]XP_043803567.1 peptidyl-tRNA hydrolase 2, mitochondrial-like [Apis laboriosa]XP_043803568.1 peptidyl-tRNA hydrolase 2, mitochondrial-like [Apis laboriosa]XP_043803570.1 peptidyl-tRNA hydrolase 2, mitochondrial-like [Apis laboriosa]
MSIMHYIKCMFINPIIYSKNEQYKMVLVVRSDIFMGKGKTAAQCAHAAVECCHQISLNTKYQQMYKSWLLQGQSKIVLKISSEEELLSLAKNARKAGLIISIIKDAGKTQLQPGTISTLGIGPGPKQLIDNLTLNLKLL